MYELRTYTAAPGKFDALNARFRDVRYTLPFLTQFWMLATPIAYPSSLVPEGWRALYGLNPMAGAVEGFRWALLGAPQPPPRLLAPARYSPARHISNEVSGLSPNAFQSAKRKALYTPRHL